MTLFSLSSKICESQRSRVEATAHALGIDWNVPPRTFRDDRERRPFPCLMERRSVLLLFNDP